ncbi:MAG: T9SS C-terminal target domain-containing protein [Calditrichaeota bacterium]|nr:MAG: T9SS C-terminal target domain-containing protein [Calditrichota bacterium]
MRCFLFLASVAALFADEPLPIGSSSSIFATAFNNSRKIARTYDDRRVVVYESIVDDREAVMMTCSPNGRTWSEPFLFSLGCSPTIAVSDADTFFVLWDSREEQGLCLAAFHADELANPAPAVSRRIIIPDEYGEYGNRSPSMDVDQTFIHLTFHSGQNSEKRVMYYAVKRDLSPIDGFSQPMELSGSYFNDQGAVIVADLEYQLGRVNVMWTREMIFDTIIMICSFNPADFVHDRHLDMQALQQHLAVQNPPQMIEDTEGCSHPSLSARNEGDDTQVLICAWDINALGFTVAMMTTSAEAQQPTLIWKYGAETYLTSGNAMPSVDDVILPVASCAVVWQNGGRIEYGQTYREKMTTKPFIHVSGSSAPCFHPSVCYKSFRPDSFDVVWSEGQNGSFRIMYRRMAKEYDPTIYIPIKLAPVDLPDGRVGEFYQADLNAKGSDNGTRIAVIQGSLPTGIMPTIDPFDNLLLSGTPQEDGLYHFTLEAGPILYSGPTGTHVISAFSDTQSYTLKINRDVFIRYERAAAPRCFQLKPLRPNPFNSVATLNYDLYRPAFISLQVYNLAGENVANLVQEHQLPGIYSVTWDGAALPSGIYVIRCAMDEQVDVKKCMLIK